ncbi:hypothetical protein PUR29_34905 [Methylobacterium ajmalii]|uniref:DUF7831 domain-containing protein n=1 Tax=Methylobacterium ajmalii TaxID=2738439 RepID=A0ABV0A4B2_9HYPH
MPLIFQDFIRRQDLRDNPDWLYVFGDNLAGRGRGGQAHQMRDEPNAVGIVTKRYPATDDGAYLTDDDEDEIRALLIPVLERLCRHLARSGTVVWPRDGVGTGRAELKTRAPRIALVLEAFAEQLASFANHAVEIEPR